MISALIRLDQAVRGIWILLFLGIAGGLLLRGVSGRLPDDLSALTIDQKGWVTFSVSVAWISCLLVLFGSGVMKRADGYVSALPIKARTVWRTRMMVLLCVASLPMLSATLIVSLRVDRRAI